MNRSKESQETYAFNQSCCFCNIQFSCKFLFPLKCGFFLMATNQAIFVFQALLASRAQLFEGRLALNPGLILTLVSFSCAQKHFLGEFYLLFLELPIINLQTKRIKTEMLFKLSNLNLNIALTLGYLNPALNNLVQYLLSLSFFFFCNFLLIFSPKYLLDISDSLQSISLDKQESLQNTQ